MSNVEFYGLEEYTDPRKAFSTRPEIVCLFKTRHLGILQVEAKRLDGAWKFNTLKNEPDLNMLTEGEQVYIHRVCAIVFRMVYDTPAAKDRFRKV